VSSVDSLSDKDEVGNSFFPVKETAHSFSPILGLALVALVLVLLGMVEGMIGSLSSKGSWMVLTHFGVRETRAATFHVRRTTCTNPSSSSSISLRSFSLCGIDVPVARHTGLDALDYSCLFFLLCSLASSSSSSSSFCDCFLVLFFFCCSAILFCIFLVTLKLFKP